MMPNTSARARGDQPPISRGGRVTLTPCPEPLEGFDPFETPWRWARFPINVADVQRGCLVY
jgi:hypothetical protein